MIFRTKLCKTGSRHWGHWAGGNLAAKRLVETSPRPKRPLNIRNVPVESPSSNRWFAQESCGLRILAFVPFFWLQQAVTVVFWYTKTSYLLILTAFLALKSVGSLLNRRYYKISAWNPIFSTPRPGDPQVTIGFKTKSSSNDLDDLVPPF